MEVGIGLLLPVTAASDGEELGMTEGLSACPRYGDPELI
jgi:hypothetical protein